MLDKNSFNKIYYDYRKKRTNKNYHNNISIISNKNKEYIKNKKNNINNNINKITGK